MDDLLFRCSSFGHIMGKCSDSGGLSDNQTHELKSLVEKEKAPKLTAKQYLRIEVLKAKYETITETQTSELLRLTDKNEQPKLTEKQTIRKAELIAKRDYKPEFDLSQGAKTHIRNIVKGITYGFRKEVETKPMLKGQMVEDESIELYNEVEFTKHKKNEESKQNSYIKGTCDIESGKLDIVIDIKSSWSLLTFPVLPDEIDIGVYEWQLRGYMWLYGRNNAELAYCMVDTPDSLIEWENNLSIHHVSHIEPELRITKLCFDRCQIKEDLIKYKVLEARKYANWYSEQIAKKYG